SAAEALGGIGSAPAIAALDAAFKNPATPAAVRQSAAIGLGRSGSPAVIPTLVRALGDPDGNVESAASAALLAPTLAPSAITPLIASFNQATPVPFNASQTLARMGNGAVPQLEAAAKSANPQTQTWAAVTLGQTDSKDPKIVAALTPLTKSGNPQVQFAAAQAINRLSGS
ncbi:MAG: HEAT repeat domain-containing protein, partial [Armatimonadetes bacterium]|nr:HEAT repeat domain-containing protein [Armatimonadota bacterium]